RHHGQELVLHRAVGLGLRAADLFGGERSLAAAFLLHAAGLVAGDLGKALELTAVEPRGHAGAEEARAVLAQVPAFVLGAAILGGAAALGLRHPGGPVFRREDRVQAMAQHFLFGPAETALGSLV